MNIVALPRDPNAYQRSFYGALGCPGHIVCSDSTLTEVHTLDLIALPAELIGARLASCWVPRVHWVFGFSMPEIGRCSAVLRVMRAWLSFCLSTPRIVGLCVAWVAPNVMPHDQVFDDHVAGRRRLLTAAGAALVHPRSVLDKLTIKSFHQGPALALACHLRVGIGTARECSRGVVSA